MRPRGWILWILVVSGVLRIVLAMRGGQDWWPDEDRFLVSRNAAAALAHGHGHAALASLFGSPDHVGFKVLGLFPAFAVNAGAPWTVAAIYFGAFGIGSIYLIGRLAGALSGSETGARWATLAAAGSSSLFYYSRHLFPYDPALCFALGSIWAGWRARDVRGGAWAGFWAGASFLTYNGTWLFAAACLFLGLAGAPEGPCWTPRRWIAAAIGGAMPIVATLLIGAIGGANLWASGVAFSHTVTLGEFSEGWTFPFEYLAHSEGMRALLWLGAGIAAVTCAIRRRRAAVLLWAGALAAVYFGLGAGSAWFHRFVVYGRIARCLVPLLCVLVGQAMADWKQAHPQSGGLRALAGLLFVALAAAGFATPLRQWYPDRFIAAAMEMRATAPPTERILVLNAHSLRSPESVDAPAGEVLFSRPHPLDFEPFLYENRTPQERARFRALAPQMQVVRVLPPPPVPSGPLRLLVMLPTGPLGVRQPLVTTGFARDADLLSISVEGPGRYQFHFDHWRRGGTDSKVLELDPARPHRIDISEGSLFTAAADPNVPALRERLYVAIDDVVVFDQPQQFYPSAPNEIDIARNRIGGTTTAPAYLGRIQSQRLPKIVRDQ